MRVDFIPDDQIFHCPIVVIKLWPGQPSFGLEVSEARELYRLLGEVLPPVAGLRHVRCCASCDNSRGWMDNMWCHENRNWKIYPDMICNQHTGM